jgi:hypothetical protein
MDFPAVLFGKLAATLVSRVGTKDRHRHLQDLTDLLSPHQDEIFAGDIWLAAKIRDLANQGRVPGLEKNEATDTHQELWLAALMRLMKRRGLLGETWIRG